MKKMLCIGAAAVIAAASMAPPARAGDREWATAGKILTGIAAAQLLFGCATRTVTYVESAPCYPAPCYVAPVTYCAPPPPPPVVVQPVYYSPPPPPVVVHRAVYCAPAPRVVVYSSGCAPRAYSHCHRPPVVVRSGCGGFSHGSVYYRRTTVHRH